MPPAEDMHISEGAIALSVRDLGHAPYQDVLALQKELQREVIDARGTAGHEESTPRQYLLLVEHDPPVITVSRRGSAAGNLLATQDQLAAAGVEVAETDRGGDITYHGPGQLVAYPILDLNLLGLRLHGYMRFLEQVVIDTLARWRIEGLRDERATGVWVRSRANAGDQPDPVGDSLPAPTAKICAMGVRITRWVSMHGLAFNVETNLNHFDLIVPCGLTGRSVTSMKRELDDDCPTMAQVKAEFVRTFQHAVAHAARSRRSR